MAEQVQLHLEARIPELKDLVEKGIFGDDQVRDIVRKRTKYEYRLKRRGAIIEDFLAYIEYEKQLEVERRESVRALSMKTKHTISDHSIVQHIYGLYQRALVKFGGNVSLWMQFLNYAVMQGGKQVLDRAIAKALKLHPLNGTFWIFAAKWEWNSKGNIAATRALLQRAIRTNGEDISIWVAFFELELSFAAKLIERRTLLGLETKLCKPDQATNADGVQDHSEDMDAGLEPSSHQTDLPSTSSTQSGGEVLEGALAVLIFSHCLNSTKAFSLNDAGAFLAVASRLSKDFPKVNAQVIEMLSAKFGTDPAYAKVRAFSIIDHAFNPESLQEAIAILDDAFEANPSVEMLSVCVAFLRQVPERVEAESALEVRSAINEKIEHLLQEGENLKLIDRETRLCWTRRASAATVAKAGAEGLQAHECLPSPSHASIEERISAAKKFSKLKGIAKDISSIQGVEERSFLLDCLIEKWCDMLVSSPEESPKGAQSVSHEIVLNPQLPILESFTKMLRAIVTKASSQGEVSLKEARSLCLRVKEKRVVPVQFYLSWIALELSAKTIDCGTIRGLFQKALVLDDKNVPLWREFILFERSQKCFSEAALLYDRAKRCTGGLEFPIASLL